MSGDSLYATREVTAASTRTEFYGVLPDVALPLAFWLAFVPVLFYAAAGLRISGSS